jgi:hypothetical protein
MSPEGLSLQAFVDLAASANTPQKRGRAISQCASSLLLLDRPRRRSLGHATRAKEDASSANTRPLVAPDVTATDWRPSSLYVIGVATPGSIWCRHSVAPPRSVMNVTAITADERTVIYSSHHAAISTRPNEMRIVVMAVTSRQIAPLYAEGIGEGNDASLQTSREDP